jgi:hypothetical protein
MLGDAASQRFVPGLHFLALWKRSRMSSCPPVSAILRSRNPDGAPTAPGPRQEAPVFSRTHPNAESLPSQRPPRPAAAGRLGAAAELATSRLDGLNGSTNFNDRVQMLFDAKVPSAGIFSRIYEFDVQGMAGRITEMGAGQLYIDFPQQGMGLLLKDGACVPTGNVDSAADIEAMQRATLLGLSS